MRHLQDCDSLSADIGAVNTVVVRRNGFCTAAIRITSASCAPRKETRTAEKRVLILGAGGSARAALSPFPCRRRSLHLCRRETARANWRAVGGETVLAALYAQIFRRHSQRHSGWHVSADRNFALGGRELHCRIVMDLIYRPERTQLLKSPAKAHRHGHRVGCFRARVCQWEMWMKRRPQNAMREQSGALRAEERGRSFVVIRPDSVNFSAWLSRAIHSGYDVFPLTC